MFRRLFSLIHVPIILVGCGALAFPLHAVPSNEAAELQTMKTQRHKRLWVSVDFVTRQQHDKGELLLVDVRSRGEYERIRIPGSINIPLFALKMKTFLKSKPVVLFNEGSKQHRLEQECKSLRNAGFPQVSLLHGGLAGWVQKGGPVQGDIFARKELNRVSPRDFFAERDNGNWVVVDVSESKNAEAPKLIPQVTAIPYGKNPEEFMANFKEIFGRQDNNPFRSILICNHTGKYPEKMERMIREAATDTVFYLEGGLQAYDKFLIQKVLIRKSKESRKIVKKCGTCP